MHVRPDDSESESSVLPNAFFPGIFHDRAGQPAAYASPDCAMLLRIFRSDVIGPGTGEDPRVFLFRERAANPDETETAYPDLRRNEGGTGGWNRSLHSEIPTRGA